MKIVGQAPPHLVGTPPGEESVREKRVQNDLSFHELLDLESSAELDDDELTHARDEEKASQLANLILLSQKRKAQRKARKVADTKQQLALMAYEQSLESNNPALVRGKLVNHFY